MKTIEIKGTNLIELIFEDIQEWLAFRKEHIGASDAPILMGASKWKTTDGRIKTPKLLFDEKIGMGNLSSDNQATRYGKAMEEPARKVYESMVDDLFAPRNIKNTKYPHLMVSLDGFNFSNDKAVEIKNCSSEDHELARNGKVPEKYYPQVQMQAMVTELPTVDYFSFHKDEGIIITVPRDDEYIEKMGKKLLEFWDCVTNFKEPELTANDYLERDKEWYEVAKNLYDIKQEISEHRAVIKALEVGEKIAANALESLSMGQNSHCDGLRYTMYSRKGLVDYKAIPELSGVDIEKYRKESKDYWSLSGKVQYE